MGAKKEEARGERENGNVAETIERAIRQQTQGHIRMLHVTVTNGRATVHGQTSSSYFKELALLAAMDAIGQHDPNLVELNIQSGAEDTLLSRR